MAVYVNFKICDNAEECSGIEVCPTDTLYWDEIEATLSTDNTKCISCDLCVEACPAGAIRVAHNSVEAAEIEYDIENDPRTYEMLMVERFGASPVDERILISAESAIHKVRDVSTLLAIEVINDEDAPCLINSVPIAELFKDNKYEYFKISIHDKGYGTFADQYMVEDCPALLVFRDHALLTMAQGAVNNTDSRERSAFVKVISSAL